MTRAINTICPWSGDPVSDTSLTHYHGHTVGFCNPGCRDKFEKATHAFTAHIAAHYATNSQETGTIPAQPYAKRHIRSLPATTAKTPAGTACLKPYIIDRDAAALTDQDASAALHQLASENPAMSAAPPNALGHAIIHRGEEADWLLLHWWQAGGILAGITARSDPGRGRFTHAPPTLIACVWEHLVMTHERNAWVTHIMRQTPNIDAYLNDRLSPGEY